MLMRFECNRSCPKLVECKFKELLSALGPTKVFSHITQIMLLIKDLGALEMAAATLGLELRRGQTNYRWYGHYMGDSPLPPGMTAEQLGKCSLALAVKGNPHAYEIGLLQQSDGSYRMLWDFWNGGRGLLDKVGDDCKKLTEAYKLAVIEKTCSDLGWYFETQPNGEIVVQHPSGGTVTVGADGILEASGFTGSTCEEATAPLVEALGATASVSYKKEYGQVQQTIGQR